MSLTSTRSGRRAAADGARRNPSGSTGARPRRYVPGLLAVLATLVIFREPLTSTGPRSSAVWASFTLLLVLVVQLRAAGGRGITVGLAYTSLAVLFHGGLLIPLAMTGSVDLFNTRDSEWFSSEYLPEAAWLSCVGILAFSIAYLVALRRSPETEPQSLPAKETSGNVSALGLALAVLGIASWTWWVYQAGALVLGSSYLDFLDRTSNAPLPYAYLAMGIGLPMAATADKNWRRALLLFVLWSLQAFVLGLRGEVLLPLMAALIVRSRQRPVPLWPVVAGGVLALCVGAFVRGIRLTGLSGSSIDIRAFNPLDGLVELGYSIRPVVIALQWSTEGESHVGIATYVNPTLRPLGLGGPPVDQDPAAFSAVVSDRVGAIGGSPIAEAFRAGGPAGVVIVLALIGVLCALLDGSRPTPLAGARVGAIAFVLILWVRNDFVPVPFQLVLVAAALSLASLLPRTEHRRTTRCRPSRPGQV